MAFTSPLPFTINTKTKKFTATGDNTVPPNLPDILRLIFGEDTLLALTCLNGSLTADPYGLSDTFRAQVDIDFDHDVYDGVLDGAESGATTTIEATFTDSGIATAPTTGAIILRQDTPEGTRERVEYTNLVVTGSGPYSATFTVSKTLTNSYSADDICSTEDPLMVDSDDDDFNVAGDWSAMDPTLGLLSVRLNCSRWTFQQKFLAALSTGADEIAVKIEIDRFIPGNTVPQKILQDTIYARGSVRDVESTTIPTADALGSWAPADARYMKLPSTLTDIGADLADADVFGVYDDSTTATVKSSMSRVWTYISGKVATVGLASLVLLDTSADHTYTFVPSELAANRDVTLPILAANDTFVFEAHTQTLTNKTISGGTITGITDLAVADGGTGASTAAAARANLDTVGGRSALTLNALLKADANGDAVDSIVSDDGSTVTIAGNLDVTGTTTTFDSTTVAVADSMFKYAKDNTGDALDIGFYGLYNVAATDKYAGIFRDASDGKFRFFKDLEVEPTTTVDTGGTGYAVATLVANLESASATITGGTLVGLTHVRIGTASAVGSELLTVDGEANIDGIIIGTSANSDSGSYIGRRGSDNWFSGFAVGQDITSGTRNSAFGNIALANVTTGGSNNAMGHECLVALLTGANNTGQGFSALKACTNSNNSAFGSSSLIALVGGHSNTAAGKNAGSTAVSNTESVFIGNDAQPASTSGANEIVIGHDADGHGSHTVTLGNVFITKTYLNGDILIGTTSQVGTEVLTVSGDVNVSGDIIRNYSCGGAYVSSASASATITAGTPVNLLANSTIAAGDVANCDFTTDDTNKRLTYTGTLTKVHNVEVILSTIASLSNVVLTAWIYKNGAVIAKSKQTRKIGTGADVGNWSLLVPNGVSLATDDYLEVWVDIASGSSTITPNQCVMHVTEKS